MANLYDVAGNCAEYVMDRTQNTDGTLLKSMMGGFVSGDLDSRYASSECKVQDSWLWSVYTSFRPALYIVD